MPAAPELVFIGPVGSSLAHRRRPGRRLNLNHNSLTACVHGVVNVCSVVVRTTEMMGIHWECATYLQRRYFSGAGVFCTFLVELVYFNQLSGGVCISPSKKVLSLGGVVGEAHA